MKEQGVCRSRVHWMLPKKESILIFGTHQLHSKAKSKIIKGHCCDDDDIPTSQPVFKLRSFALGWVCRKIGPAGWPY